MQYFLIIVVCALVVGVFFARADAQKAERLEALKKELLRISREQARANKIKDSVYRMSDDDVRQRLRNISDK